MKNSETNKGPPTEMLPVPDSTFALPKKNVGKAIKTNKGKDFAADKDDEETTTVKKAPEVRPAQEAAPAKRGRGKKAAVSIVDFEEETVEEVKEAKKRVAVARKKVEVKNKSAVLEEVAAPAEVTGTIESLVTVPAEIDTKEKRGRGRQASSKDGTENPAKTSEEPLPDDEIESSLPELSPQLPMDEKRKHEEEWQDFVKNGKFTTQEFLSYTAQWRDCADKTEPWFQRMKVIYLNLEELKLERDALKEKVESLDQLAIERTEIINMYIKELVIEDKNLEANVLNNHQERRVLEKSFMSRNSAPVPSRSTLENSDEPRERVQGAPDKIEKCIEAQEAAPTKRGRGKKAAVSIVDFEEETVEEVKEAKKRVAVARKKVEVKNKSAVLEEVAAPAEVTGTIESPETVPAKKSRGIKAAGKKDTIEEAVVRAEPEVPEIPGPVAEEKAVEVTTGTKPKTGPKSKVGPKSKMETKPAEEEDKSPSIAEPEVAEKKLRGKKVHLSADYASQATPNVDEMDGPSSSGGDVASFIDDRVRQRQQTRSSEKTLVGAFIEIDTLADQFELPEGTVAIAKQLFEAVKEGQHSKGFRTHTVATTCLYIAARQKGDLRTIDETCAVSKIGIKEFRACFQRIRTALNITLAIITTSDFIPRFCFNLGLPNNVQIAASHIGRKAFELDIVPGRCPTSVAATAIYMACHASDNKLTKKELCDVTGVTDSTIRQLYKLMYPRVIELFPGDFKLILDKLPPS